jgi:predicted histidine transporter YuiF (NhaC family)
LYIQTGNTLKKVLQGDKIETPEYIKQNNLQINYTHYITNQLMKPMMQLLGLALEQIYEYKGKPKEYQRAKHDLDQLASQCVNVEDYMKKRDKYCSARIRTLIFEPVLLQLQHKKMGMRDIRSFCRIEPGVSASSSSLPINKPIIVKQKK